MAAEINKKERTTPEKAPTPVAPGIDEKARQQKNQVLEAALTQIVKQFGKGSIMRLGKAYADMSVSTIPTGALGLDVALGVGGIPRGRITEIYGPESSGKTTLALHVVAEAQRLGGNAAFIDVEHALDPVYAKALGVNVDELLVSQPSTGEEALEIVDTLVRSNAIDIIIVDSVAALVPRAEIEGEMGDSHVGLQARLMSQAMRKLTGSLAKSKTALIFINQIRMMIGVMFGNPETTTGGKALKFYSTIRMEIRRTGNIESGTEISGNRVKVKIAKNKVAPPFRQTEFDIMYGEGISREGGIVDEGVTYKVIDKAGAWFTYGDIKLGQGRENAKAFLKENKDLAREIELKVLEKTTKRPGNGAAPADPGADDDKKADLH